MFFTSPVFFAFFALFLLAVAAIPGHRNKVFALLLAGAVFYGYWDWRFLGLLAFVSVFEYRMAQWIASSEGAARRRWLALDVVVNLGLLSYFKYANFFIDSLNDLGARFGVHLGSVAVILPIGISFFTFEAMSYAIDVYRGQLKPFRSWLEFAAFIFFFPRMIAGPIIRASDFIPQLRRPIVLTGENFAAGAQQFTIGLTKKLLIADRVAPIADATFANPAAYSAFSLWQGVLAYAVQIYCDFSGYSDMAMGIARILGFELPPNFRLPYLATSLTEFWRRWHMSLSSWLRDYLYIPLGGSRGSAFGTYRNLIITMVLGGLWHGANWTFVLWGAAHGLGLALERATAPARARWATSAWRWLYMPLAWLVTQGFVWLAWVLFRAQDFALAHVYLTRLFSPHAVGIDWVFWPLWGVMPLVVAAHWLGARFGLGPLQALLRSGFRARLAWCAWLLSVFYWGVSRSNGFIYFQF